MGAQASAGKLPSSRVTTRPEAHARLTLMRTSSGSGGASHPIELPSCDGISHLVLVAWAICKLQLLAPFFVFDENRRGTPLLVIY